MFDLEMHILIGDFVKRLSVNHFMPFCMKKKDLSIDNWRKQQKSLNKKCVKIFVSLCLKFS